jgi:hypothetical protein
MRADYRDRGGSHSGDAAGLTDRSRTSARALLDDLSREAGQRVIEIRRDEAVFQRAEPFDALDLPADVALISDAGIEDRALLAAQSRENLRRPQKELIR